MCHALDLQFSAAGRTPGMICFQIHNLQRLPPPEILGPAPIGMLPETPLRINGDSGIERVVGAENNIDVPGHSACLPSVFSD